MRGFRKGDYLISFVIVLISFLYFFDSFIVPSSSNSVNILGIKINSFGFIDFDYFFMYSKMKLLIIVFCSIWFLNSKDWWKYAILIPISIEFSKLFTALDKDVMILDHIDYINSLTFTIPIIILLIFISFIINKISLSFNLKSKIDLEIETSFFELINQKREKLSEIKIAFEKHKSQKDKMNKKQYLIELNKLKDIIKDV